MNNLNAKAVNRKLLNEEITAFYNGLIENLNYIICNRIKPINEKEFLNFKDVADFVDKNYTSNKYRKLFNEDIKSKLESIKNPMLPLSVSETRKIQNSFSNLIDKFSDHFQTEFNKKLISINRTDPKQLNNFKQGVYNQIVSLIEDDFNSQNLPENYKLNIKTFNIETQKQA